MPLFETRVFDAADATWKFVQILHAKTTGSYDPATLPLTFKRSLSRLANQAHIHDRYRRHKLFQYGPERD
jgi:hypothetical protein